MEKLQTIFGKEWAEQLQPFLRSPEFDTIGKELRKIQLQGRKLVPHGKHMFRPFSECPWNKMHTLILAGGPYTDLDSNGHPIADGLAFSARTAAIAPRYLEQVLGRIVFEVFDNNPEETMIGWDNDLSYLANDGILLLNTSITGAQLRYSTEHVDIWKHFISYVVRLINNKKDSMGVILMGNYAKAYKHLLDNETFGVFQCEHPHEAFMQNKIWTSGGVFKLLHDFQKTKNNITIKW